MTSAKEAFLNAPNQTFMRWKPISEAVKDGREIWAFNGEQIRMKWIEGKSDSGDEWALWSHADELLSDVYPYPEQPTHFMDLPAEPDTNPETYVFLVSAEHPDGENLDFVIEAISVDEAKKMYVKYAMDEIGVEIGKSTIEAWVLPDRTQTSVIYGWGKNTPCLIEKSDP